MDNPLCYKKKPSTKFRELSSMKIKSLKSIEMSKMKTLFVKEITTERIEPGFAFPYPSGEIENPSNVTFRFLNYKNASKVVREGSIKKSKYIDKLNSF